MLAWSYELVWIEMPFVKVEFLIVNDSERRLTCVFLASGECRCEVCYFPVVIEDPGRNLFEVCGSGKCFRESFDMPAVVEETLWYIS